MELGALHWLDVDDELTTHPAVMPAEVQTPWSATKMRSSSTRVSGKR
jgi:hypothetical protein